MKFSSWLRNWKRSLESQSSRKQTRQRKSSVRRMAPRPRLEALEDRTLLSAYVVTTTADSGIGSLRDAINQINADTSHALYASPTNPNVDEIDFNITAESNAAGYAPGQATGFNATTGVATIQPQSALAPITNAVIINGYTQGQGTSLAATPNTLAVGDNAAIKIDLDGSMAGLVNGLNIGSNSTVAGLAVTNFGYGQEESTAYDAIVAGGNNQIIGDFLGTDVTGAVAEGNGFGVVVFGNGNTIGGTDPAMRNVIGGNGLWGVSLRSSGNVVEGSYIGTDHTGTEAFGNARGVLDSGSNNTIGGSVSGAGNVISDNEQIGIHISGATGAVIQSNFIGTDATGTRALGNGLAGVGYGDGIRIDSNGSATITGNVISANLYGISFVNNGPVVVQGNLVGTDATGKTTTGTDGKSLGNAQEGISGNGPATIGGTTAAARNVISGNGTGIDPGLGDVIEGNYIGTDITGTKALANHNGVWLTGDVTLGGTAPGDGNLISGNGGIGIRGFGSNNAIEGNLIGTDVTGTKALGNGGIGIDFQDGGNNELIGGLDTNAPGQPLAGGGNVITDGISFGGDNGPSHSLIEGNYIGTDIRGTTSISGGGVGLGNLASYNTIGGTTAAARNIISGSNGAWGADIDIGDESGGTGVNLPSNNLVEGNYIGTDATGTVVLGNGNGLSLHGAINNTIGGTASGAGNLIMGGQFVGEVSGHGIFLWSNGNPLDPNNGNVVQGNTIKDNQEGVYVSDGTGNTIGGTASGAGNVISDNASDGIYLGSAGNFIEGNNILTNTGNGVTVYTSNNTLGGTATGAGNVISGNSGDGVFVGNGATGVSVLGNSISASGGLGIHLDSTSNANDKQAAPVLTTGTSSATSTAVSGTLTSVANTTFRIEFFSNHGLDTSGNAEGLTYLGFTTVTTDSNGNASFTATNLAAIPAGQGYLTATATNQSIGDTSQFSNYLTAPTSTVLTSSANPSLLHQSVTFTATVSSSFGTPTGSVDFVDTTTNTDLGTVALSSGGTASVTVSNLAVGSHVLKATYLGQGFFLGSSSTLTQQVSYKYSGFLAPLSNGLAFAVNRTIPIKFSLSDYNGTAISSLSAVTSLQIQALDANGNPVGAPFNPTSTNNQGLQYSGGQYQFNWQTKGLAAGSYEIVLKLADGTTQTKTIKLTAGGNSAGLVTDGTGGTTTAGALLGGEVDLYVDNSNGDLTSDELARINDAVTSIDATIAPYGVMIVAVSDPTQANVTLNMSTTSSLGGDAQGVLGCTTDADQVTMIQGWSWYTDSDPTQVGSGQYDFETAVMHELGHVLGLGHSSDSASVMYATLAPGTANRTLVTADLNVPDDDSGSCALHAVPTAAVGISSNDQRMTAPSSTSVPGSSGGSLSVMDQVFANFALLLSSGKDAYQSELSSLANLWQSVDALASQRLDALLSLEAGAMGITKDALTRDFLFASRFSSNG